MNANFTTSTTYLTRSLPVTNYSSASLRSPTPSVVKSPGTMVPSGTSVIKPKCSGFTRSEISLKNTRGVETSATGQITSMNLFTPSCWKMISGSAKIVCYWMSSCPRKSSTSVMAEISFLVRSDIMISKNYLY